MKIIRALLITLLLLAVGLVSAQDEEYRVHYGDTIDVIAQEHNVSVACIAEANNLTNANALTFGQVLTIPAGCDPYDPIESVIISHTGATSTANTTEQSGQGGGGAAATGAYRVHYGDTIDVIAQDHNVSVACLVAANNLTNTNALSFGQMLTIPDTCSPYDSMESVILSNIDNLDAAGFTQSDMGQGGGGGSASTPTKEATSTPKTTTDTAASQDQTYVVQAGDNLTKIAEHFGVTNACLQSSNGIVSPDLIYTGQQLLISGSCQGGGGGGVTTISANRQCFGDRNPGRVVSGGAYTVKQGDTLDFIGCDLNMNTTCLIALNNLDQKGGNLAIGQRLTISGQCAGWVAP